MFRFFTTYRNVCRTAAVILFATFLLTLAAFSWRRALQVWGLTFPFVLGFPTENPVSSQRRSLGSD